MPRGLNNRGFDPFQIFEVSHQPCVIFVIRILRGRKITKGRMQDLVDTPDPYIILYIKDSPNGWQQTTVKDNDTRPIWNETFTFFLDSNNDNTLELTLMDANYTVDEVLCTKTLSLNPLPLHGKQKQTVQFNGTSECDIEMWAEIAESSPLRYSLALCSEEKQYIDTRRQKIYEAMRNNNILGDSGPRSQREVPVVGVLGSGGGFRAMTAFSGVMAALVDSNIIDMVTYVAGLSGSAWYLSHLYSHPDWPERTPGELREELRNSVDSSPFWLLGPQSMFRYIKRIMEKRRQGQPVSFTDFFGHLVGETLLKERMESKLSDQQQKVQEGTIPMPLYTCLHVKKSVSAMIFHEWMEFSPFEIGMPKYGTFMKPELFGCKFFMGQIVKRFPEPSLHFLQGIWGSAFCIQFKRLLQDDKKVDAVELIRREREELERELQREMDSQTDEDSDEEGDLATNGSDPDSSTPTPTPDPTPSSDSARIPARCRSVKRVSTKPKKKGFWDGMVERLFDSSIMQSIEGRAAMVHNFMRGLSLNNMYPISPFSELDDCVDGPASSRASTASNGHFKEIFDMHPTNLKRMYVVDGGLTFNSPFPLLLRPQRHVDLLLSFDFSARPCDSTPPFKELLLAEKWARMNNVPFPPIDPTVVDREGLKECYIFKDPKDPHCPVVMHFVLINITFRDQKKPGVPRTTQEEKDFADFDIFDDPERPYSTFNFRYTHNAFDRLTELAEFNTLLYVEEIKREIRHCIRARRRHSIRRPCNLKDIKRLSLRNRKQDDKLEAYIRSLDNEVASVEEEDKSEPQTQITRL
ncbi:cytosolic phospholipase A2-like isoform X2 [Littorina saxatilis]|uniref:Phospholipase A2 n=1 Tax=Littorina saxatilis TaxID=31220 RepID=A0AAN9AYM1_9CAEN